MGLKVFRRLGSDGANTAGQLRASVGSTDASASPLARVGVVGPTRASGEKGAWPGRPTPAVSHSCMSPGAGSPHKPKARDHQDVRDGHGEGEPQRDRHEPSPEHRRSPLGRGQVPCGHRNDQGVVARENGIDQHDLGERGQRQQQRLFGGTPGEGVSVPVDHAAPPTVEAMADDGAHRDRPTGGFPRGRAATAGRVVQVAGRAAAGEPAGAFLIAGRYSSSVLRIAAWAPSIRPRTSGLFLGTARASSTDGNTTP